MADLTVKLLTAPVYIALPTETGVPGFTYYAPAGWVIVETSRALEYSRWDDGGSFYVQYITLFNPATGRYVRLRRTAENRITYKPAVAGSIAGEVVTSRYIAPAVDESDAEVVEAREQYLARVRVEEYVRKLAERRESAAKIVRDVNVEVVKGRKVPKGSGYRVTWVGTTQYGDSAHLLGADGKEYKFVSLANLKVENTFDATHPSLASLEPTHIPFVAQIFEDGFADEWPIKLLADFLADHATDADEQRFARHLYLWAEQTAIPQYANSGEYKRSYTDQINIPFDDFDRDFEEKYGFPKS